MLGAAGGSGAAGPSSATVGGAVGGAAAGLLLLALVAAYVRSSRAKAASKAHLVSSSAPPAAAGGGGGGLVRVQSLRRGAGGQQHASMRSLMVLLPGSVVVHNPDGAAADWASDGGGTPKPGSVSPASTASTAMTPLAQPPVDGFMLGAGAGPGDAVAFGAANPMLRAASARSGLGSAKSKSVYKPQPAGGSGGGDA